MTYRDAIMAGYKAADTKFQRGYVSRLADPDAQPVQTAGGNRKGQLYVPLPCYCSTQYCVRQYLCR